MDIGLSSPDIISVAMLTAPGAVFIYARTQFLTGRMPSLKEGFASFLLISIIYHSIGGIIFSNWYEEFLANPVGNRFLLSLSVIVPGLFGVLSGLSAKGGWASDFVHFLFAVRTVHPIGSAWDWHFSNCQEAWVIVTLDDGTQWGGILGQNSFISSDRDERDLFLEQVYSLDAAGLKSAKQSSVWISKDGIRSIESWPKSKDPK